MMKMTSAQDDAWVDHINLVRVGRKAVGLPCNATLEIKMAQAVPMGVPIDNPPPGSRLGPAHRYMGFSSGLCDCFSDCCSCWAVVCCSPIVLAQFMQRIMNNKKGVCLVVATVLWISTVAGWVQSWAQGTTGIKGIDWAAYSYDASDGTPPTPDGRSWCVGWTFVIVSLVASIFGLACFLITCALRMHIRKRDGIPAACIGGCCDDCCHACFCSCCVLTQVMRHEGLVGGRYKLTAEDGVSTGGAMV